jgi:hypothetical protein
MGSIKLRHRNILTLRCFHDLSYADIATATGGTELQARLLFFRAKRSLRQQLASRGYRKKEQLLPALSLFAALTAGKSKAVSAASLVKAATLDVSVGTAALGLATTKIGAAAVVTATVCVIGAAAGVGPFASGRGAPGAAEAKLEVLKAAKAVSADPLQNPGFERPSSIGKANDLDGSGFPWTDRASKAPSIPRADVQELLVTKPEQDLRAVIVGDGRWIDFQFANPIVDAPGADIIVFGWSEPPPALEVYGVEDGPYRLMDPALLADADVSGRQVFGYDLTQLPGPARLQTVRLIGTHDLGPHQGFELGEIVARVQ